MEHWESTYTRTLNAIFRTKNLRSLAGPESIRCINTGEFFIWRCLELFHALGLDYWDLELPPSPIVLGRVPKYFSHTVINSQCLIVSPHVSKKTKTDQLIKFRARSVLLEWPKEHLLYFPLLNDQYYNVDLKTDEILMFDPGCELPNFLHANEIESAIATCGIDGEKVDYFLAIVAMMNRLGKRLSTRTRSPILLVSTSWPTLPTQLQNAKFNRQQVAKSIGFGITRRCTRSTHSGGCEVGVDLRARLTR